MTISRVHLIFKTHLDIGFTDYAANVVSTYFNEYIPRAIHTARTLRENNSPDRFIWTTGSWLIYEYLENASPEQRRELETAILAGDIVWHGLPFTTHSELMDASLFNFGLSLSQTLDRRFGRQTIAAKLTDVPGHTRGIVPLLVAAGIRMLHIGVNEASTLPDVPPVFRWQNSDGSEVIVIYEHGYGRARSIPGLPEALAFGHTSDNLGPQTVEQAQAVYAAMRAEFPEAQVGASTLDDFARALLPFKDELPVVTGEIGDTWIHGAGSDPYKLSRFRALQRLRTTWLDSGQAAADNPALNHFSRKLILIPEHTWGMDEKIHLADHENYSAFQFKSARQLPNFQKFAASWAEQRAYLDQAVEALDGTALQEQALAALTETTPQKPDLHGWKHVPENSGAFETPHFAVRLDSISGAMNVLHAKDNDRNWADPQHRLGLFRYQTFSQADYDRFFEQYIRPDPEVMVWAVEDYSKPGLSTFNPEHRFFLPQNVDLYYRRDQSGVSFLVLQSFPNRAVNSYGCPKQVTMEWFFPVEAPEARLTMQWFDKQASRLPEALWLSFVPAVSPAVTWEMDKLGQAVSPLDVVPDGNRKLHGVGRGVTVIDGSARLEVNSLDAALLAPGEPSLLNFNNDQPILTKGLHFNLYNNIWGTNFPMWFGEDARFRFVLR